MISFAFLADQMPKNMYGPPGPTVNGAPPAVIYTKFPRLPRDADGRSLCR